MTGGLYTRLARLESIADIQALKAHYTACADGKYQPNHQRVDQATWQAMAHAQAACFTEDAEWHAEEEFGGIRQGRAALTEFFLRSPWRFALHFYLAPDFTNIAPDHAAATWRLWQIGIQETGESPILLAGRTQERYRRGNEGWQISSMRFVELHRVDLLAAPAQLTCLIPLAAP
jgi:SnoaL-like domain